MDSSIVCAAMDWRSACRSIWRIHGAKPTATAVNTLVLIAALWLTQDRLLALVAFFSYCFGVDLIFGRCCGMMICGTCWIGSPTIMQKLIYNSSYVCCFGLMLANEIACACVMAAQITSVISTGKTTHGLLADMNSAIKNPGAGG
jgi:hypothetical protein